MKRNEIFWYNKAWSYIYFVGMEDGKYVFEDYGDKTYVLTEAQVKELIPAKVKEAR